MAKKRRSETPSGMDSKALSALLRRAHLKGILNECVITFDVDENIGHINAVDISNSVFISCQEEIANSAEVAVGFMNAEIGLGNLALICKYLEDKQENVQVLLEASKMTLKAKGSSIKVPLIEPEEIPNAIEDSGSKDKMFELATASITPTTAKLEDLLYHIDLIKPPSIVLSCTKETLIASTNQSQEDEFRFLIGKMEEVEEPFSVEVYSEHFVHIMKYAITEELSPTLLFGEEAPVIVQVNEENFWALTPIQD